MMGTLLVVLSLHLAGYVLTRGPHHPRGASIAKHHVHYRPTRGEYSDKLTSDLELLHDTEHIQEELGDWAQDKDISAMSDEELEFHYFQLHDFDKNNQLDGLEILQAIYHTADHDVHHDEDDEIDEIQHKSEEDSFEYYVELIDRVLKEDDTDVDGYLSYPEYVAGRKRELEEKANAVVPVTQISTEDNNV